MPMPTLEKQRRDALRFELICLGLALAGPAIAAYLLWHRMPEIMDNAAYMIAPIIPSILLILAAIGFDRLRRAIDRRIRAGHES